MALRTPPSWLQAGSYTAENDRLTQQAVFNTSGIVGAGSLAVTQQVVASMTLNIASGWAAILGANTTTQGVYVAYNDATATVTLAAADPTNPRIDRIVVTVSDATYSGSTNQVAFSVLTGTAAPSPAAPSTPTNSISLATVAVAAGVTTITNANITDTRVASISNLSSFAKVLLSAGTATSAPLQLTSGTNLTSPASGAFEYDGSTAFFTPVAGSGRGSLAAPYVYVQGSTGNTSTPSTSAVPMFPGMANGLQVQANTMYEFEIVASWNTSNATNKNITFNVNGGSSATSSTLSSHLAYAANATGVANATALSDIYLTAGSLTLSNSTNSNYMFVWKGVARIATSGYFQPQMTFSTAPGTYTMSPGSYIKITPVLGSVSGGTSAQSVGAWS